MPFFLYRIEGTDYVRARGVALAGQGGPFCARAMRSPENPEWELSKTELVQAFGVEPERHAVIIDLKPRIKDKVSLYRLKHAWGYSSHGWTPVALELEALFVDESPPMGVSVQSFKSKFPAPPQPGDDIYEFLYLNGDGKGGTWSFGRVGSVNAPLLWDSVLDSFIKRINLKRQADGLKPLGLEV